MSSGPATRANVLVIDSNVLIRAVLGQRVLPILEKHANRVAFVTADVAFSDVLVHVPAIMGKRGASQERVAQLLEGGILERLRYLVSPVPYEVYADRELDARRRLVHRDELDWPFLALALTFACPIWTEDQDFFGAGIATWTTDRVEIFLEAGL